MVLSEYTYVFVIGTFFAMLDAYNNGMFIRGWISVQPKHPLNDHPYTTTP